MIETSRNTRSAMTATPGKVNVISNVHAPNV